MYSWSDKLSIKRNGNSFTVSNYGKSLRVQGWLRLPNAKKEDDKDCINRISKEFTEAWYNYDTQTSKDYLEKIKPYMTKYFYEMTYYINTKRLKDFKGQVPTRSKILSIKILSFSDNKTQTEIVRESYELTTHRQYKKKIILDLIKEDNKWLVSYLRPVL